MKRAAAIRSAIVRPAAETSAARRWSGAGSGGARKPEARDVAQLERQPREQALGVGADEPHQPQRLGVGADQDVLAVVEVDAVDRHAPRAAAQAARGFEDRDRVPALRQRHGGGEARPAGADDRYAATHVRQAIQSLRIGVSATRCASTREPSRRISSSRVR